MSYCHGDKVFVDLDLSYDWTDKKLEFNNTYVTIDKFIGYWETGRGFLYETMPAALVDEPPFFNFKLIPAYAILEDNGLYYWPEDEFGVKEEEVACLLE